MAIRGSCSASNQNPDANIELGYSEARLGVFENYMYTYVYRCLQLPAHTLDKIMFCQPVKIQSFDNQTSKVTRPLWSVLVPLRKQFTGSKVSNTSHILSFAVWTPCLKCLPSLFIVNAMSCQTASKSATIILHSWRQNVPKWAGKFGSLSVKTLNFDWLAEHVFVRRVDR